MSGIRLVSLHFSIQPEQPEELHYPPTNFFGRKKTSKVGFFFFFFSFSSPIQKGFGEDPESEAIWIHPAVVLPVFVTQPLQTASVRRTAPPASCAHARALCQAEAEGMKPSCGDVQRSNRWDPASWLVFYPFESINLEVRHCCHADTALAAASHMRKSCLSWREAMCA